MDHLDVLCFSCKRRHPDGACPLATRRRQPVVDLLESTMIDPIDEIHAAAERRGYMDDAGIVELVRIARADLARRQGVA